jgi:hypothetical protein
MASPKSFDFTAKLEIAAYRGIIQHPKAVYDRCRAPGHPHNLIGIEVQIGFMADGQDDCIRLFECAVQILTDPELTEFFLVSEEARP